MGILLENRQVSPVQISPPVSAFLGILDQMSRATIGRRDDLGALLEAAYRGGREQDLDALAFTGKFCVRAFGIMKRIGPGGEGYDRLAAEFSGSIDNARRLLVSLLAAAPEETRMAFTGRYLSMAADGIGNLMALLSDLSWVKNWQIDNPGKSPW
jgi:hypothetical protein